MPKSIEPKRFSHSTYNVIISFGIKYECLNGRIANLLNLFRYGS